MVTFKNYTPHPIKLNDGRIFESVGVARVSSKLSHFDENGICTQMFGEVTGLPETFEKYTLYIVSSLVMNACATTHRHSLVVAPSTGHPETVRDDKGFIVSVPGFVRNA